MHMTKRLKTLALVVAFATPTVPGFAGVIGFVNNPTTNSTDFTAAAIANGATIDSNVNFETHPLGPLQNNFYTASDGVTFSTTGTIGPVQGTAGATDGNTTAGPLSTGEGRISRRTTCSSPPGRTEA